MDCDKFAKPGEPLWKDLLEPPLYNKLKTHNKLILGYLKYRTHRNGSVSILECKSRSKRFDVTDYLKNEFKKWEF